MFEHSLIHLEEKKRPRRRRWTSLPIAIGFHLAILASVLLAQAWSVSEVPEPDVNVVFFAEVPPPPPPAAAPARSSAPTRPVQTAQTPTVKPPLVQPEATPDTTPTPVTSPVVADMPAASDSPGVPWGVDGGDGDGDGDTIGGDPNGVPHSAGEPEPQVDPNLPIRIVAGMKRPEFLSGPQPRYTETARKAGVQGVVILEAIIDEQGRVTNLKVLKGLPMGLDKSAVEAVSQWRYRPATLEKRAVKVIFNLTVNFQLQR